MLVFGSQPGPPWQLGSNYLPGWTPPASTFFQPAAGSPPPPGGSLRFLVQTSPLLFPFTREYGVCRPHKGVPLRFGWIYECPRMPETTVFPPKPPVLAKIRPFFSLFSVYLHVAGQEFFLLEDCPGGGSRCLDCAKTNSLNSERWPPLPPGSSAASGSPPTPTHGRTLSTGALTDFPNCSPIWQVDHQT